MINISQIEGLLAKVPGPPEDAIPSGASPVTIAEFEQRTGISVPDDLRDWLRTTNGPCVGPGGVFGIRPSRQTLDIERYLQFFPQWKSNKWIPIAGDGSGNYYIVATQQEYGEGFPVLFVDTSVNPDTPAYIVASDVGHFFEFLLKKELGMAGWPFKENVVVQANPEITKFKNISLPWD